MLRYFIAVAIMIVGALSVQAKVHRFSKQVNRSLLVEELRSAGFKVLPSSGIGCKDGTHECWVWLDDTETKNPQAVIDAHVYVDFRQERQNKLDAMKPLLAKWRAGTIGAAEKDQLLRMAVELLLGE